MHLSQRASISVIPSYQDLPQVDKPESLSHSGSLANNKLETLIAHFLMQGAAVPSKNMAKLVQNFAADTVIAHGGMMANLTRLESLDT